MIKKLSHGLHGIKSALKTEPTLSMQLIIGSLVATLIAIFIGEWWLVKQTIFLTIAVMIAELINTSFEYLCDLVEPNKNRKVKKIKDVMAGVVLIMAIGSIIITIVDIFGMLMS